MDSTRELCQLLKALHEGLVDPQRLAEAGVVWSPKKDPSIIRYLVGRGMLSEEGSRKLDSSAEGTVDSQAAPPAEAEAALPTVRPGSTDSNSHPTATYTPNSAGDSATADGGSTESDSDLPRGLGDRYRVIRHHRRGGLGNVWLVHDRTTGRDVAMKTIRREKAGSAMARVRFVREARITAQLEHPSIVPVHDLIAGPDGNSPAAAYTMRFISGPTLAERIDHYHVWRVEGGAQPLDLAELLDAFIAVCRAVAHAHARGILHRDLKGQNVVVGDLGEVFLVDWGLGKNVGADDPSEGEDLSGESGGGGSETETQSIVGTPAYMAPEVANHEPATAASDIYGLGAILYAILAGRAPVHGLTVAETIKSLREKSPQPPRTFNADAPHALQSICAKAMARRPSDRYASAGELALEVRRWLLDEPIRAHRDSALVRLGRWSRRHRPLVASLAVFLVSAVVALAASTALVYREERRTLAQRDIADANSREAREQRNIAEGNFREARSLVFGSFALIEAGEAVYTSSPGLYRNRKELLETATRSFRKYVADDPENADLRARAAAVFHYTANVYRTEMKSEAAEALYAEALGTVVPLRLADPGNGNLRGRHSALERDLASCLMNRGRYREAAEHNATAVQLAAEARAANAGEPASRRLWASAVLDRSAIEYCRGNAVRARADAEAAAEEFGKLRDLPAALRRPYDRLFLALALSQLGILDRESGDNDAAVQNHWDAARNLAEFNAKPQLEGVSMLDSEMILARVRADRAESCIANPANESEIELPLTKAVQQCDYLIKSFPGIPCYRLLRADALRVRGIFYTREKRQTEADRDFGAALADARSLVKEFPSNPCCRIQLADVLHAASKGARHWGDNGGADNLLAEARLAAGAALQSMSGAGLAGRKLSEIETED